MASQRHSTITKLERTARRLIADKASPSEAIEQLQAITDDPQLLGQAAGRALGRWEVIPFHSQGQEVATLLIEAGADKDVLASTADSTARRLRKYLHRG